MYIIVIVDQLFSVDQNETRCLASKLTNYNYMGKYTIYDKFDDAVQINNYALETKAPTEITKPNERGYEMVK